MTEKKSFQPGSTITISRGKYRWCTAEVLAVNPDGAYVVRTASPDTGAPVHAVVKPTAVKAPVERAFTEAELQAAINGALDAASVVDVLNSALGTSLTAPGVAE